MRRWRSIVQVLTLVLCLTLGISGCTNREPETARYAPEEDRRLVVYTSHKEEVYWPIVREFEDRTGIWVEVVAGGTNELLDRLVQEREAPRADVMFGGGVDSLTAYADCFNPYFCRDWEELDPSMRADDGLWTPFSALPVVLIYNTKLVPEGRLTAWSDLLDPFFRGRIAFCDPGVSGSSYTGLVTMLSALDRDWDETLQDFAHALAGRQLESSGAVLDNVAGGTDLVGITLEETALKRAAEGAQIALVYPSDGTSCVPDGGALVKGAAHEENARLFLDFISGEAVQGRMQEAFSRRPIRAVGASGEDLISLSQIPLTSYDIALASQRHNKILMSWAFYFGEEDGP